MTRPQTAAATDDTEKNIIVYNRYSNVSNPYKHTATDDKTGLDLFLEETGAAIVLYEVNSDETK